MMILEMLGLLALLVCVACLYVNKELGAWKNRR